ncbi:primosomal protein N' [Clostridium sp. 'deep sea']|uniref:replication restart helicase PriA n=1 Tax=Clostridium sp. 'deep sea' TaxID=2779445 RepID=UPI0018966ADB|nr:primosomal protein N' [Clostridium sp. 'deep sea']QOR36193.1 primosomal protein N' [Clostridium sp. 'deep sea']
MRLTPNYQDHLHEVLARSKKQLQIINELKKATKQEYHLIALKNKLAIKSNASINALIDKKILVKSEIEVYRSPLIKEHINMEYNTLKLNRAQKNAVLKIFRSITQNEFKPYLLHGVTGSGKTEVYLRSIQHCLNLGKQAILLVPEITLTPQTIERLTIRFGSDIAVLHSSLSKGERYDEWRRIATGKATVVVGARSAVFAPLAKLGVIIIDEEHESTYKQQDNLRYDARQIALWRAKKHSAAVIYGSATPAITSYYKAQKEIYELLEMPERITKNKLPQVNIVDMRTEIKQGNRSILSRVLQKQLLATIDKGEKALILLNRRGYSSFLRCSECGDIPICENCDITLTYHSYDNKLKCHYCDTQIPASRVCSKCKQSSMKLVGTGTQKVEKLLEKILPETDIIRMDSDTTRQKNSHFYLLEKFKKSKSAVLVGTQMIAKGLDIKEITLVGVIDADIALNLPDYRADERTFQLLTQVAGRSGRGEIEGKVIIQTFSPKHFSITEACKHNYKGFYEQEIKFRSKFMYPPFKQLIRIICVHEEQRIARRGLVFIYKQLATENSSYTVLNPTPAPLNKINNKYRWHLIIKYDSKVKLHESIKNAVAELRKRSSKIEKPLRVIIDINPENIL